MLCFVIVVDLQQIRGGLKEKIVPFDGAPGRSICFVLFCKLLVGRIASVVV